MADTKKKTTTDSSNQSTSNKKVVTPHSGQTEKNREGSAVQEKKVERSLLKIFGFLIILVLIFYLASAYFESLRTIEYEGLTFVKEKVGQIQAYKYNYYFQKDDGGIVNYNLYVRNNPAENPVTITGDPISLPAGLFVYLGLNFEYLEQCEQGILAIGDLSRFLSGNTFTIRSGSLNEAEAEAREQRYITCESQPDRVVIEITQGDESKIEIDGNCHRLYVNECNILPVTEKYIVHSIVDAKAYDQAQQGTALAPSIE